MHFILVERVDEVFNNALSDNVVLSSNGSEKKRATAN
jgi:hypothetical protein